MWMIRLPLLNPIQSLHLHGLGFSQIEVVSSFCFCVGFFFVIFFLFLLFKIFWMLPPPSTFKNVANCLKSILSPCFSIKSYRRKLAVESPLLYQKVRICKHFSRCKRGNFSRCWARSEQWHTPWGSSSEGSRWCNPEGPTLRHILRELENCNF